MSLHSGGRLAHSSNSNRVVESSPARGVKAQLIDRQRHRPEWLAGIEGGRLTAGASAPEVLVEKVPGRT